MKSKYILILHTTLFTIFVISSVVLSAVVIWFPALLPGKYLFYAALVLAGLFVILSLRFGGCPFTTWENYLRERERPGSAYHGSCMVRYEKKWFNMNLPGSFDIYIPAAFIILPTVVGLLHW